MQPYPPSPSPPLPSPPPPPPASPFVFQMSLPTVSSQPLCPAVEFIVIYTLKLLYLNYYPVTTCTASNTNLLATLEFADATSARAMAAVFDVEAIGQFVTYFQVPCNSFILIAGSDIQSAFTSANVPELNCPPPPPAQPLAPPARGLRSLDLDPASPFLVTASSGSTRSTQPGPPELQAPFVRSEPISSPPATPSVHTATVAPVAASVPSTSTNPE